MSSPPLTVVRAARPEPLGIAPELFSEEEEARFEVLPEIYDGAEPVANYFGGAAPSQQT